MLKARGRRLNRKRLSKTCHGPFRTPCARHTAAGWLALLAELAPKSRAARSIDLIVPTHAHLPSAAGTSSCGTFDDAASAIRRIVAGVNTVVVALTRPYRNLFAARAFRQLALHESRLATAT